MLDRFAAAFENADVAALAALLREDVTLEMPPMLTWFAGRDDVTALPRLALPRRARPVPAGPGHGQRAARLRGVPARAGRACTARTR